MFFRLVFCVSALVLASSGCASNSPDAAKDVMSELEAMTTLCIKDALFTQEMRVDAESFGFVEGENPIATANPFFPSTVWTGDTTLFWERSSSAVIPFEIGGCSFSTIEAASEVQVTVARTVQSELDAEGFDFAIPSELPQWGLGYKFGIELEDGRRGQLTVYNDLIEGYRTSGTILLQKPDNSGKLFLTPSPGISGASR
ncbi:MAG: hypothetical protein AAGJ32_11055 [Pseudomonadota bacterium]